MILKNNIPTDVKFEETVLTPFALAMPIEYKTDDAVESYRKYYMSADKQKIATWKKGRTKPEWYKIDNINKNIKIVLIYKNKRLPVKNM